MSLLRRFNRWRHERRLAKAALRRHRADLFARAQTARTESRLRREVDEARVRRDQWEATQRRRLIAAGLPAEVVNAPLSTPPAYDDPPTTQLDLAALIPQPRREDER